MRERDRILAENLVAVAAETGRLDDAAKVEALKRTWVHPPRSRKRAVAIVDRKLRDPRVRELVEKDYGDLGDFTIVDAIKKHVEHIRGPTHKVMTKAGEIVELRDKPSWPALKAYLDMALPQPAKKVARSRLPFISGQTPARGDR